MLTLYDDFAAGAQLSKYIPNYSNCRYGLGNATFSYIYLNEFSKERKANTTSAMNASQWVDNITLTIGNTSSTVY
jgi:hypothetical protein